MNNRFDFAQPSYWRMQFVEPEPPENRQYVMLYGEEGEIVGPLTMALAEAWIDHFGVARRWQFSRSGEKGFRESGKLTR